MIDLAMALVKDRRLGPPQESRHAFELLRDAGLIDGDLVRRMAGMVGFRNVAVHDYRRLNLDVVNAIVTKRLGDFRDFARRALRSAAAAEDSRSRSFRSRVAYSQANRPDPETWSTAMTKRERVMAALGGKPVDRVPLAWLHNFATENTADGLATETLRLAKTFDWDFLKPQSRAQCFAEMWGLRYSHPSGSLFRTSSPMPPSATPAASRASPPPIRAQALSVSSSKRSAPSAEPWAPIRPSSGPSSRR